MDEQISSYIVERLHQQRSGDQMNKNVLMTAAYAAGLPRVRELLCQKLENILLNNKIREVAQEVLAYCCANIQPHEADNISLLIGIRWRQKPPSYYLESLGNF